MKTLRLIGMALMAVLMCVNFASCSNEEVVPDEPTQDKYITVGLDCVGEFLEITNSPLSRAVGDDLYFVQVFSVDDNGTIPYAYGIFETSLNGLTINLLQGEKYNFKVAIVVGGCRDALKSYYQTTFKYSSDVGMGWEDYGFYGRYTVPIEADKEGFYGELDGVIPEKDKNVEISTKRVSYAAKFIAQNLSEGTLDIAVKRPYFGGQHTDYISLTPSSLTSDKIYSFANAHQAWKGIYKGTDSDTGEPIYENYSSKKTLEIKWNKGDGTVIPFGIYSVTFKRNVKTTIRINVADLPSVSNGITVTKEETTITDDENEYNISGGKIVEVPVTSEP